MSCKCLTVTRKSSVMGRVAKIIALGRSAPCLNRAIDTALAAAADFETSIDHKDSGSELQRLCRAPVGSFVPVSENLHRILVLAGDISYKTDGVFDVAAAGCSGAHWTDIDLSRGGHVRLRRKLEIALGGLSKGYVADLIAKALEECGVGAGLVDVGGCIRAYGRSDWCIEFGPNSTGRNGLQSITSVPVIIRNGALAGFGHYFGMSKLIDFKKGLIMGPLECSGENILVRAPSAALADALTKIAALGYDNSEQTLKLFRAVSTHFTATHQASVNRNEPLER